MLDTDHLSFLERADSPEGIRLRARLQPVPPGERVTTIVSFEEQVRGWLGYLGKARSAEKLSQGYSRLQRLLENLCKLTILEFSPAAAARYERLQRARLRVKPMDLRIAAIVLANNATLLTRNLRDFCRIPGVDAEDWTL